MKFHCYTGIYAKTGEYFLKYNQDITWNRVVKIITTSNPLPKLETPAIVMNRFKEVRREITNGWTVTVPNRYSNLDSTTGWFALDVDETGKLTQLVISQLSNIAQLKIIWVSSSGNGVKAIGFDPILSNLSPQQFKETYRWLCLEIRREAGLKINFDKMMGRCHQPIFLNSDRSAIVK